MTGTTTTGSTLAGDGQESRRKKLRFRSWHRGMREMDFVLGRFADAGIDALTGDELDQYEGSSTFRTRNFSSSSPAKCRCRMNWTAPSCKGSLLPAGPSASEPAASRT
jgi:hypothetical protein